MGQFDSVVRRVNKLTGRTSRHLKALNLVADWAESVQHFLEAYKLLDSESIEALLESPSKAKFDLVGVIYNGRPIPERSRSLGEIPQFVSSIVEKAEAVRRYLIEPVLQEEHLVRTLGEIRSTQESLLKAIDEYDAG